MIELPHTIKPLNELEKENPELFKIMKRHQPERFIPFDWIIVSQPQDHPDHQVYGIFVVDKEGVKKKIKNPSKQVVQVKQDFLVYDRANSKVKYYRGLLPRERPNAVLRPIAEFCMQYGGKGSYYGCYEDRGTYLTTNHHYLDENDSRLPTEEAIRKDIREKLERARHELTNL